MAQKCLDVFLPAVPRMTPPAARSAEAQIPFNPTEVSLFGSIGVMPEAQRLPALVQKFEFGVGYENRGADDRSPGFLPRLLDIARPN